MWRTCVVLGLMMILGMVLETDSFFLYNKMKRRMKREVIEEDKHHNDTELQITSIPKEHDDGKHQSNTSCESHKSRGNEKHRGRYGRRHDSTESEERRGRYGRRYDSRESEERRGRYGRRHDSSESEERRRRYDSSKSEEHRGRYGRRHGSSESDKRRGCHGRRHDSSESKENRGRYDRQHDSSKSEKYRGRHGRYYDSRESEERRGRHSRRHDSGERGEHRCRYGRRHDSSEREEHQRRHGRRHESSGSEEHRGRYGRNGTNGDNAGIEHQRDLTYLEPFHVHDPDTYVFARCDMAMNPTLTDSPHNIKGMIIFRQKIHKPLEVLIDLEGFSMASMNSNNTQEHGFHVHQYGDLSDGCQSFGGHFNPEGVTHGSQHADQRHAGDWGNIACDSEGRVNINMTDHKSYLVGPHSVIGRGIVIHALRDDLGLGGVPASLTTGNAGARLACCPIVWWKGAEF